jgi:uncharacterized membrane protein
MMKAKGQHLNRLKVAVMGLVVVVLVDVMFVSSGVMEWIIVAVYIGIGLAILYLLMANGKAKAGDDEPATK